MNITRENNGELSAYLKLELVPQDYEGKVEAELKSYRKKVQMKGFRQGQVPAGLVKQLYGKAILMEEINKIAAESIENYIKENKLELLGHALPAEDENRKNEMDFDHPGNFVFWFEIGLIPSFDVELEKIKVTGYEIKVPEETVDKHIESLCRRYGKTEHPETADLSDTLSGELTELDEENNPKEGGIQTKTSIAVDLIALKTIQKQFTGKKAGDTVDFEIQKAFKNKADLASMLNVNEEKLAEISPKFRFRIDTITRVIPAEANEDLFKKAYPHADIKDMDGFRAQIRKEIAGYHAQNTNKKFFVDTVDSIIDHTRFELPEAFVKRWVLSENNRSAEEKKQEPVADIPEEEMKQVLRSLRWELIQNRITEKYGLKIEMEDLRAFYKDRVLAQYFPVNSQDPEEQKRIGMFIDSMMKNQEEVKRIYDMVFEEKLTALFREKVQADRKEVEMEQFVEILRKDNEKKNQ